MSDDDEKTPGPPRLSQEEIDKNAEKLKAVEANFRKAHGIPADVPYDAGGVILKKEEK